MKSAQLLICLTIASLIVGCGSQKSAVDDGDLSAQHVGTEITPSVNPSVAVGQSLPNTRKETGTSADKLEGFVSPVNSSFPKSVQNDVTGQSFEQTIAIPTVRKSSVLASLQTGRDNPFALAEQPEFEVRFVPAQTSTSLPPVPNVGLGPEPGASLQPGALVVPMELSPSTPVVVVPQELAEIAVAPDPQLVLPAPSELPPVVSPVAMAPQEISPTALAEAVEIKGVVQLGDQVAVIVNEGEGRLSRTVQEGARLAGGQVELRRIETTAAEPQVVLVQNGVEIVRGVGV